MKILAFILIFFTIAATAQDTSDLRTVDGKTYDRSTWTPISQTGAAIKVITDSTNGTICQFFQVHFTIGLGGNRVYAPGEGEYIVVKNYPDDQDLITDHFLKPVPALKTGKLQTEYGTLQIYDCGLPWTPQKIILTPEQIAAAQKLATAKKTAAAKRAKAGAELALKSNQDAAATGDSYGLLRMGERYRDGDGVERDLAQARQYLTKAKAAGSASAGDELDALSAQK